MPRKAAIGVENPPWYSRYLPAEQEALEQLAHSPETRLKPDMECPRAQRSVLQVFTITTQALEADMQAADALVKDFSPHARKTYSLGGTQKYELPTLDISFAKIFTAMERAKSCLTILDWGVSNSTLEEVFIKFARSLGVQGGA